MGSFCWTMLNLSCLDQAAEEAVKQSPAEWPWGFRIAVWVGRFSDWVSLFFPPSQPPSSYNLKPFPPSVGKRDMPSAAAVPHCAGGTSLGCGTAVWDDQPHPPPLWTLPRGGGPSSHRWMMVIMNSKGCQPPRGRGLKAFGKDMSLSLCSPQT